MSMTTIRVGTDTRDALARIADDRKETMDAALRRLVQEHEAMDAVELIEQWEASMSDEEKAITAALDAADREEQATA